MSELVTATTIIHTTFGFVCIWALLCFGFRDLRIDYLRHKLFSLRDELFDCGVTGLVAFDDDAYRLFRQTLNGMIRFAHKATLLRLFLTMIELKSNPALQIESTHHRWTKAVEKLPHDTQVKLLDLHYRMVRAFVVHLVLGSPTLPLFGLLWTIKKVLSMLRATKAERFAEQFREPLLEAQALEEQEESLLAEEETDDRVPLPV